MDYEDKESLDLWTLASQVSTTIDADIFFTRIMLETKLDPEPGTRSLLNTGLQTLMENTRTDAAQGEEIINKHILPLCLGQSAVISSILLNQSGACEILSNWLQQYPDESRIPLRAAVLRRVLESLEVNPSVASIRTLAAVGLRSRWIENILAPFVDYEGPLSNAAIDALCALRPRKSLRFRLIRIVLQRDPTGLSTEYDFAIQTLASPKFIPSLSQRLFRNSPGAWRTAFLLGRIADAVPGDRTVQNRVFRVFQTDLEANKRVISVGNTISNCNTARAVRVLLAHLEQPGFKLHLLMDHLKDCVRPEQLKGWHTAAKAEVKAKLATYATLSGGDTRSMTIEDHMRRSAWELALCSGITDVQDWLSHTNESSPFDVSETFAYSSFLIPQKWSPLMIRLATEKVGVQSDNQWLFARMAAGQAIAATEKVEALKILVDCGMTGNGAPLRSTTELVGDLVERLAQHSLDEVVAYLLYVCEDHGRGSGRMSAIVGLQRLAALNLIPQGNLDRILSLAEDDSLPEYATAAVIWVIASFQAANNSVAFTERLIRYLEDSSSSGDLKFQSLQALIHLEIWGERSQTILRALGISSSGSRIGEQELRNYQGWQSYGLGLLVPKNPEMFHEAAKQLLENGQGQAVHLLLQALATFWRKNRFWKPRLHGDCASCIR